MSKWAGVRPRNFHLNVFDIVEGHSLVGMPPHVLSPNPKPTRRLVQGYPGLAAKEHCRSGEKSGVDQLFGIVVSSDHNDRNDDRCGEQKKRKPAAAFAKPQARGRVLDNPHGGLRKLSLAHLGLSPCPG